MKLLTKGESTLRFLTTLIQYHLFINLASPFITDNWAFPRQLALKPAISVFVIFLQAKPFSFHFIFISNYDKIMVVMINFRR